MYIEYGAEDLMMDELVRVMNYFEEKVGNEVEMVWGAGRNDELGNQLEILLLPGGSNYQRDSERSYKIEYSRKSFSRFP